MSDLNSMSEGMQEDLICLLDSQFGLVEYIDEVKTAACQIIVDRINELKAKIHVTNTYLHQ